LATFENALFPSSNRRMQFQEVAEADIHICNVEVSQQPDYTKV
jgi:hypothetical protein